MCILTYRVTLNVYDAHDTLIILIILYIPIYIPLAIILYILQVPNLKNVMEHIRVLLYTGEFDLNTNTLGTLHILEKNQW